MRDEPTPDLDYAITVFEQFIEPDAGIKAHVDHFLDYEFTDMPKLWDNFNFVIGRVKEVVHDSKDFNAIMDFFILPAFNHHKDNIFNNSEL